MKSVDAKAADEDRKDSGAMELQHETELVDGQQTKGQVKTCGIIMPISAVAPYESDHWDKVYRILKDAVVPHFEPRLVSQALDVGIIQNRIVVNLFNNDVVICD